MLIDKLSSDFVLPATIILNMLCKLYFAQEIQIKSYIHYSFALAIMYRNIYKQLNHQEINFSAH